MNGSAIFGIAWEGCRPCGFGKVNYLVSEKAPMWLREWQLCGFGKGNYFGNADIYSVDV